MVYITLVTAHKIFIFKTENKSRKFKRNYQVNKMKWGMLKLWDMEQIHFFSLVPLPPSKWRIKFDALLAKKKGLLT